MSSLLKLVLLASITVGSSTIISETGCTCVVTKTATTAPGAAATVTAGCSTRLDWLGQQSRWCLTDQTLAQCGTMQAGFGYVDSCQIAAITTFNVTPPAQLEWDQTPTTFYTGQLVNVSWSTTNIQSDELLKITYMGSSLRTLSPGVNASANSLSVRLSDATSSLTSYPVPVQISSIANPSINVNSTELITVLQSRLTNVTLYDNASLVTTGTVTITGQNLTIMWRGVGQAQIGVASVTIRSSGGGGGGGTTVGTPLIGINASATMIVNYLLPRSFVPNGFSTYSAQITVTGPGTPYTATSSSFRLQAGPSPSASLSMTPTQTPSQTPSLSFGTSPSQTPTASKTSSPSPTPTPTASLSTGSTASNTPTISVTSSITPSQTPTVSITSSASVSSTTTPSLSSTTTPSQTPAPSVDILAITKAAAQAESNRTAAIAGGVVGGLAFAAILGFTAYKVYERKQLRERRLRKHRASLRTAQNRDVYGLNEHKDEAEQQPTVVMYQIQGLPQQQQRQNSRRSQLAGYQSRSNRNL